jgi:hypothetical protein
MVLFSLSVVVSVVSLAVNVRIFASTFRKRLAPKAASGSNNRIQAQVPGIRSAFARSKSMQDLKDELEFNKFSQWQHYCTGLLLAVEVCLDTRPPSSNAYDPCHSNMAPDLMCRTGRWAL